MTDFSVTSDGFPYSTQEGTFEYRLKKTKNGEYILQRANLVKNYKYDRFYGSHYDWRDVETVKEEE